MPSRKQPNFLKSEKIECVLFDLGDTLFEPLDTTLAEANLREFCVSCGIKLPVSTFQAKLAKYRESSARNYSRRQFYLHREYIIETLALCTEICGDAKISRDALETYANAQRDSVVGSLKPRPNSFSTLEQLRERKIKTGIVSNIDDDWLNPLIRKWRLYSKVDLCLSSESARSCKPNRAIFKQAQRTLAVRPSQTVFVGDSELNDIEGANNENMTSVLFHEGQRPADSKAQFHIQSIGDVLQLLDMR